MIQAGRPRHSGCKVRLSSLHLNCRIDPCPNRPFSSSTTKQLIRWSLTERLEADGLRRASRPRPAQAALERARRGRRPRAARLQAARRRRPHGAAQDQGARPGHAGHPADRVLDRRHRRRGDEARRVSLRQQAVQPRRDRRCWSRRRSRRRGCAARCAQLRASAGAALQPRLASSATSPRSTALQALLQKVAASPASTVLLTGESGTGKDLAAKVLHYTSDRASRPFMNITCSALPEQLLESELFGHERGAFTDARPAEARACSRSADGGTVFLDEIGEMAPALQAKLLRFLEEKTFKRVGGVARHPRRRARRSPRPTATSRSEVKPGHVPRGSLLPAERPADRAAAAARARRRHPAAGRLLRRRLQHASSGSASAARRRRRMRAAAELRLAGQHPRAAQRDRARDAAVGRRSARRARLPGADQGGERRQRIRAAGDRASISSSSNEARGAGARRSGCNQTKAGRCSASTATRSATASRSSAWP